MKHRLQTFLRHKLQWLVLLTALLGVSQGVWGTCSYKCELNWGNCHTGFSEKTFYPTPGVNSTQSVNVYITTSIGSGFNVSIGDNCSGQQLYVGLSSTPAANSLVRAVARKISNNLYCQNTVVIPQGKIYITPSGGSAIEMTKGDNYVYTAIVYFPSTKTFSITGNDITATTIENQNSMPEGGKPNSIRLNYTNISSNYSLAKIKYDLYTNKVTIEDLSAPTNVVNGTDVMFYVYQSYDSPQTTIDINNGSNDNCMGTATKIDDKHSYIQTSTIPSPLKVSNNCGKWAGTGDASWTSESKGTAQGAYYLTGETNSKTAATTVTVSPSSSSIPVGTTSISLSITGNKATSSYGDKLYALIYVDGVINGYLPVSTSTGSYTLITSSLDEDDHTIETILTDFRIYYIGDTQTLKVNPNCTPAPDGDKSITINNSVSPYTEATVCSGTEVTVTVASSQSGYIYRVYDDAATPNKVGEEEGTGEDLDISFTPSASATYTVKAVKSDGCTETEVGANTVSVTVNTTPSISASSSAKNFEVVSVGSDVSLDSSVGDNGWSITNQSDEDSYLYETGTTSAKFKGTVGTGSNKGCVVRGTASNGCYGEATITVSKDPTESCN